MLLSYRRRARLAYYPPWRWVRALRWWVNDRTGDWLRVEARFTVKAETARYNDAMARWGERFDAFRDRYQKLAVAIAVLSMLSTGVVMAAGIWYAATVPLPPLPAFESAEAAVAAIVAVVVLLLAMLAVVVVLTNLVMIPLLPAVLVHELAHGVVAEAEGYEVQGVGLLATGPVIAAAYCRIYDPEWRRRRPESELLVYAAGPVANILLGGLLAAVALPLWWLSGGAGVGYWAAAALFGYGAVNVLLAVSNMVIISAKIDGGGAAKGLVGSFDAGTRARLQQAGTVVGYGVLLGLGLAVAVNLGWVG